MQQHGPCNAEDGAGEAQDITMATIMAKRSKNKTKQEEEEEEQLVSWRSR